jgi:hypothetical protein
MSMNSSGGCPVKRIYKWPWFVLAAAVAGILLALVWMGYAVHRQKQEQDFNAPIPTGSK